MFSYGCCMPKPVGLTWRSTRREASEVSDEADNNNLLVEELNGLTMQEREQLYEEIHGVADIMEETPDFVAEKLAAMREELGKIPKKNRKALDRAIFLRPSLPNDDKLHLLFLRAERFDPVKAAGKLSRHFEHKFELFGDSKLVNKIMLEDLSEAENEALKSGFCQLLTTVDRAGRGIYFMTAGKIDCDLLDWKGLLRCAWYQIMSALEDNEELQKRGVVQMSNLMGKWKHSTTHVLDTVLRGTHIIGDWPFRSCGFHLCYDNATLRSAIGAVNAMAGKELRIRERTHYGSEMEVQYALLTFGIALPGALTSGQGIMSRNYIDDYISKRRQREAEWKQWERNHRDADPEDIEYPNEFDVLMGRGSPSHSWIGNQRFSARILAHVDRYMQDTKDRIEKTMLTFEIVQRVQLDGGRFLERTSTGWATVADQVAKDKCGQILRSEWRKRTSLTGGRGSPAMAQVLSSGAI